MFHINKIKNFNKLIINTFINNNNNNYKKLRFTTNSNSTTTINKINEFSFKVEKEIKQGDDLLIATTTGSSNNIDNFKKSIKFYENGLNLTKDRIERALIHYRISIVKFKLGLISECNDQLNLSLQLLPTQHNQLYKIYILKSILLEKEFEDKFNLESSNQNNNNELSIQLQQLLDKVILSWKDVILNNPNSPDGYCGVARCILKSSDPNLPDCFNYADKSIMCDRNHPPSLLLASEMLIIQNKHSIAHILLSLFFKNFKNFYYSGGSGSGSGNIYTLKQKELADAYFRYGLTSLYIGKYEFSIKQFTESISIINLNLQNQNNQNQSNLNQVNNLLEKYKNEFENNFKYSNLNKYEGGGREGGSAQVIQQSKSFNFNQINILDLISNHYFRGKSFMFNENYNEAIKDFTFVIDNQPNQVKAFKERAECFRLLGDFINYQKDIKVYNDYRDSIKKRRTENYNNYLQQQKNRKRKEYLQNFSENYDNEQDDDDEYDEDDEDYDGEQEGEEYEDDDEDYEDDRYYRK